MEHAALANLVHVEVDLAGAFGTHHDAVKAAFAEMKTAGKLTLVSTPYSNGIQYIGMNVTKPPFDNPKVRQAIAYAQRRQEEVGPGRERDDGGAIQVVVVIVRQHHGGQLRQLVQPPAPDRPAEGVEPLGILARPVAHRAELRKGELAAKKADAALPYRAMSASQQIARASSRRQWKRSAVWTY